MSSDILITAESFNPRTGSALPAPPPSTDGDMDATIIRAAGAAPHLAAHPPRVRARWLDAIADALTSEARVLAALADEETALGLPRLTAELVKATDALRFYGSVAREGSYLDATIDTGSEHRPDVRRVNVPLGPVAVFGASNFPFGFSVLGHDTGSALAAGCPVVVKAHPAHPRLSARLADLAGEALATTGAPAGTFALVSGFDAGKRLVTNPMIRAVAFTGSQAGGLTLWRLAATREEVIPVYAEMGTVNAAVVTPAAATERIEEIAAGFVGSFTLGMGQYCTKPGLLIAPSGAGVAAAVRRALLTASPAGWLLTSAIAKAYAEGLARLVDAGARPIAKIEPAVTGWTASPAVLQVDAAALTAGSAFLEECFGPVALVAEYRSRAELAAVVEELPGSLATAVHSAGAGDPDLAALVTRLSQRCGRVVVNGWPTGVALGWAQQHGGPWPATSVPAATSVGAAALKRFVRPVAYQDVPDAALPPPLQHGNPWGLRRRIDGAMQVDP